jgi:YHS domain-containing protein
MKRMLALSVAAVIVLSLCAMAFAAAPAAAPTSFDKVQLPGVKATCIVTSKELTIAATTPFSVYETKYYYFTDAASKAKFDAKPTDFVKPPVKK